MQPTQKKPYRLGESTMNTTFTREIETRATAVEQLDIKKIEDELRSWVQGLGYEIVPGTRIQIVAGFPGTSSNFVAQIKVKEY